MTKILLVDGITKEYPGRVAVGNVSFEVHQGSIHGFLGPNGAGKSSTMRMIAGLIPATAGKITLFDQAMTPDNRSLKNKIGLLPENPPLYFDMTVENYLQFVARLHGVKRPVEQAEKVLTELSLLDVKKRLIGNLSKGYKQRVGLAGAIVYDAPFLILDEPTNGLDPQSVVELRDFIKKLAQNKTILFSSHVLSEVEQLCDHVTIIHQGKIRATGDLQEIHRKFHQGLVLRLGVATGELLPDLTQFGPHTVGQKISLNHEDQYHLSFEEDRDVRSDLLKYLMDKNTKVLTIQVESPELEDIFLHMTETKR